jgi:ATP-dependent exoDNAse (exonuclease V) beta subunit
VVPVRYRSALAESVFAYDYFEEQVLCVMDNLNVLYVAFTRARQRIYGWAPKEKISETGINTMGKLLQVVASGQHSFQTAGLFDTREGYDATTLQWVYGNKVPPVLTAQKIGNNLMPALHYHLWQQGLQVRYRALETAEDTASRLPREQGVLLHEVLARLLQPDELVSVLHQMQWQGLITQAVMEKMQSTLQALLDLPVLQPWVTGRMQRLAERSLLTSNREIRRPDWVLYNDTKTSVIDFKFTDDEKNNPQHEMQVLEYMQLLGQAGFSNVEGFVVYGNSLQVVKVF